MDEHRRALLAFGTCVAGCVVFIAGYWTDASLRWMGAGLTVALLGLGLALVFWARAIDEGDATETRPSLAATDAELTELSTALDRSRSLTSRRSILAAFAAAVAAIAAAMAVPLRSLGPRPSGIGATPWKAGRRLVTSDGRPVGVDRVPPDGLLTVYPESALDAGDGAVVVMRLPPDALSRRTVDGGALDGIVAYSKICTHAGCAVGLFQADSLEPHTIHRLLCPCHQSEFNPLDGAEPVAGPATRPLPQLPLRVDPDGHLVARDGFDRPVGPASWTWP